MIVKKMKRTNFSKSKASMISELVDYIFAPYDELGREKLAHYGTLNFLTTTQAAQKNEMIALAEESIQSRMPVAHWVLSWKDAEQPTQGVPLEHSVLVTRGECAAGPHRTST